MREKIKSVAKPQYIVSAIAIGGIAFAATNFSNPLLFQNTENFVLFAQEEIKLEQGVQVSSGDLGANEEIDIQKDAIINGNLFADKITLDKNTVINGNVSFNKLKLHKEAQILGTQTKPVQLPIAVLPDIPDFQIGTQDFKFTGENNTLSAGSYSNITLEKQSRLTLTGGIYNLNKLELRENSTLIFNAATTLNIQFKLRGKDRISILPGLNVKPDDLKINYLGIRPKHEKEDKEDDDEEIESEMDDKEKKEHKDRKIGRPIVFGQNSFLNFKLLAPKASVHIEKETTLRGRILARKIKIGKDGILSKEEAFVKESDPAKIVTDPGGNRLFANEIIVLFSDSVTDAEIEQILGILGARITGIMEQPKIYKFEVNTATITALLSAIEEIKSKPFVIEAVPNFIGNR